MNKSYRVITNDVLESLVEEVNACIGYGYEPIGGISIVSSGEDRPIFVQAIRRMRHYPVPKISFIDRAANNE